MGGDAIRIVPAPQREDNTMSILEELWRGNITPNERAIKPESEYHNLFHAASAEEKRLLEYLSAEGREIYDSLCRKRSELAGMSEMETFIVGFRMGARVMLEVLGEYDGQFAQVGEGG